MLEVSVPYSINDTKNLPANVKSLDRKKQLKWVAIWNSVYDKTGDEGRAFKEANGAIAHVDLVYYREDEDG
jgi:hypothetical protein